MGFEQYIGCVINYNGWIAVVEGFRSNYDGDCFYLSADEGKKQFTVNAFDGELLKALPDPEFGILKRRNDDVLFMYKDVEYLISDYPYEPCLYIKKDGHTVCVLHNAFTSAHLPEWLADGPLMGIDGEEYDRDLFSKVLAAAIDSGRGDMDFTFAAGLVK